MMSLRLQSDCYVLGGVVGNKCHSYCVDEDTSLIPYDMFSCKLLADGSSNWEPTPDNCAGYCFNFVLLLVAQPIIIITFLESFVQATSPT